MIINNSNCKHKSNKIKEREVQSNIDDFDFWAKKKGVVIHSKTKLYHGYLRGCCKYIKHQKRLCPVASIGKSTQTGELSGNL